MDGIEVCLILSRELIKNGTQVTSYCKIYGLKGLNEQANFQTFSFQLPLIVLMTFVLESGAVLNIDTSNIDPNFQYFRYPTTTAGPLIFLRNQNFYLRPKPKQPDNKLVATYKKAKAAYEYFMQVLSGDPLANQRMNFVFKPDVAMKNSKVFQEHYGKFGERLIDLLGMGKTMEELKFYGAVSQYNKNVLR